MCLAFSVATWSNFGWNTCWNRRISMAGINKLAHINWSNFFRYTHIFGRLFLQAALGYLNQNDELSYECGATIISESFVLTAAHCTKDRRQPVLVRYGTVSNCNFICIYKIYIKTYSFSCSGLTVDIDWSEGSKTSNTGWKKNYNFMHYIK